MASPAIRDSIVTNGTTASATPVVNLPATVVAGDLLVVWFRSAVVGTVTYPGGGVWTEVRGLSPDGADDIQSLAWKLADGTEGGTTITLGSGNGKFAACAWAISGADPAGFIDSDTSVPATGTTPNQPDATTVTPVGGSKDYLFGTLVSMEGEATVPPTYPTGYTLGQLSADSGVAAAVTTNVRVAGAWKQATAASDNPGPWTYAGTLDDWTAYAIAIHPEPGQIVTPPTGALTLTGVAPSLAFAVGMVAGALGFTGQAPVVDIGGGIPPVEIAIPAGTLRHTGQYVDVAFTGPDTGALRWTGYAPSVDQTHPIAIPAGSLLYSGQAPSLAFGLELPAGILRYAGQAPTVVESAGGETVAIPSGALLFTGQAPALSIGESVFLPAGALIYSGQVPDSHLDETRAIPAGVLVFGGQAPLVSTGVGRAIPAGVVTFTGQAPSLFEAVARAIPAGALTWTGYAPSVVGEGAVAPQAGVLVFSGQAPSLSFTLPIAAGSLQWTGAAPTVLPAKAIDLQAGSLLWTGQSPTVSQAIQLAIPAGSLRFTGQAPALGGTVTIAVPPGALVFTGLAPSSVVGFVVPVSAGALEFTGQAPTLLFAQLIEIPAGDLRFTGTVPGLAGGVTELLAGQLVWTGYPPTPFVGINAPIHVGNLEANQPTVSGLRARRPSVTNWEQH